MKGTLKKVSENEYSLFTDNKLNGLLTHKLSIKNCQAIENGYDLDELAEERTKNQLIRLLGFENKEEVLDDIQKRKFYFIEGAKAILEILGDKKFSEEDVHHALHLMNNQGRIPYIDNALEMVTKTTEQRDKIIQSLQPKEWEIEIEMICPHPEDTYVCGIQYGCDEDGCNNPNQIPYLDKNGCLILKRI